MIPVVRRYLWCDVCEQRTVPRAGDVCVMCLATVGALVDPDTRPAVLPLAPPLGVRVLDAIARLIGRARPAGF